MDRGNTISLATILRMEGTKKKVLLSCCLLTCQSLPVILCHLRDQGRKEIEEQAEKTKGELREDQCLDKVLMQ